MRVLRSHGEPDLVFVLLRDAEITEVREALRKDKRPLAKDLRRELKKVMPRA